MKITRLALLLVCFGTVFSFRLDAQDNMNVSGTEFRTALPPNTFGHDRDVILLIYGEPGTVCEVSFGDGTDEITFSIGLDRVVRIELPDGDVFPSLTGVLQNAIGISSSANVKVELHVLDPYQSDAMLVLPLSTLGVHYMVDSYAPIAILPGGQMGQSWLIAVAYEEPTILTITPSVVGANGEPAAVPIQASLNAGETFRFMATSDLSGSEIFSQDGKPFAVLSGSSCARVPSWCGTADAIFSQMLPVENWGHEYIAGLLFQHTYTLRVTAATSGTVVNIGGMPPVTLAENEHVEVNEISSTMHVSASGPISVTQYMEGKSCVPNNFTGQGDPAMTILLPLDRLCRGTLVKHLKLHDITSFHANILVPISAVGTVRLDGVLLPSSLFTAIVDAPQWQMAVLALDTMIHAIDSPLGMTGVVYAKTHADSYLFQIGGFDRDIGIGVYEAEAANQAVFPNPAQDVVWIGTAVGSATVNVRNILGQIVNRLVVTYGMLDVSQLEEGVYFLDGAGVRERLVIRRR